ncbi:ribonuclease H1-like [Ceratina calcarata]|uniref:Ribonuclease H1 n=1 Tax=Ceratina calcarata TaxID=156304 RepID=A0AAJ7N9M3_9HYME|nr:ribonuclease H1-like [Ceratina calcarata]
MTTVLCSSLYKRLTMAPQFYAVARGRKPGIYNTWDDCKVQVHHFSGPKYKKFHTRVEAEQFIKEHSQGSGSDTTSSNVARSKRYTKRPRPADTKDDISSNMARRSKSSKGSGDFLVDSDGYVNVYTDGACSSNGYRGAKAGIGVWFGDDHPMNVSEPVVGRATNNRAEIEAVTRAARQAKEAGIENLQINTDSKFLINCANDWMPKWKSNGWRTAENKPVINKNELLEMESALDNVNVRWKHVNGHAGIHGNEMADQLARAGSSKY